MSEPVSDPQRLSGARDVRVTLDDGANDSVVVACPPHPQFGGDRHDGRLKAVSDALADRRIDCLRIDYGAWDEGEGERADAVTALDWAGEHYDRVGLFGYSFGGGIALLAAAADPAPRAVTALAPVSEVESGQSAADALDSLSMPVQIVYGERDGTADWQAVVERARERGNTVKSLEADHFFVGQREKVATLVAEFLGEALV